MLSIKYAFATVPLTSALNFMELINSVAVPCPLRSKLSYYKASNNIVVDLFFVGEIIQTLCVVCAQLCILYDGGQQRQQVQ